MAEHLSASTGRPRRQRAGPLALAAVTLAVAVGLAPLRPVAAVETPANDDFVQAVALEGVGGSWNGTTAGATTQTGEPVHAGRGAGSSVWLTWTAPVDGMATFTASAPERPVVTASYTGKSVDSLQPVASSVGSAQSGAPLRFPVVRNSTYHVAVDELDRPAGVSTGPVTVDYVVFTPANDDFGDAQRLTGRSVATSGTTFAATRESGEPQHVGSTPTAGSVWFAWTAPDTGTGAVTVRGTAARAPVVRIYTGAELSSLDAVPSDGCGGRQCFSAVAGQTYLLAAAGSSLDGTGMSVEDDFFLHLRLVAPGNDDLATAAPLSGGAGRTSLVVRGSAEPGEPDHAGLPASHSRWYDWTPTADGVAKIALRGSGRVAAYARFGGVGGGVDDLRPLGATAGDEASSRLRFPVSSGASVLIAVDSGSDAAGSTRQRVVLRHAVRRPPGDRPRAAVAVPVPGSVSSTNLGATPAAEPAVPGGSGAAVWFRFQPVQSDRLVAQTTGSRVDTVLGVYVRTRSGLRLLAADDDGGPGDASLAGFRSRVGRDYVVGVDAGGAERGELLLSVAAARTSVVVVEDAPAREGRTADFAVTASPAPRSPVRVAVATSPGRGASPGVDYESGDSVLRLSCDRPSATFGVPVRADRSDEAHETVQAVLSSRRGSVLVARPVADAVISDDDPAPRLRVEAGDTQEGGGSMTFTASLTRRSERPVLARLSTVEDLTPLPESPADAGTDYGPVAADLVLPPGQLRAHVGVPLRADALDEPDEAVLLSAGQVTRARPLAPATRGRILDDDPAPTLRVADLEVVEGASGSARLLAIPVRLRARSQRTVTFSYTTVNATAVGPFDFRRASGVLQIAPAQRGTVVNVLLRPDNLDEGDAEFFYVDITEPDNAVLGDERGRVLIVDDD